MVQVPRRTGFSGPTLVRLLTRLTDVDAPDSGKSLSSQLSQWLGWADAIALSSALNGSPPAVRSGAQACASAEARECARVRAALAGAIADDGAHAARRRGQARPSMQPDPLNASAASVAPVDYAAHRQRYLSLQQTMETGIGSLRGRLRIALSGQAPGMARLATVDAVMERVLGAREQSLLETVPSLLEVHFGRLRQAEETRLANAQAAGEPATVKPGTWLNVFRKDMQSVLLAELDIRFQPIEGLLAALRAS
ncbi:DUF3348 domain-containing protein [Cupriavidus sp. IDO]|uniref:DUF3348 domain-containing protein n=1 Tax=Cupriavidus sp. IDO TaxID=1539142 RepID=UPI000578EB47|nr:DUF3348 domain-containing protein [Cupriavidus sp. IDO]KWR88455.1 hypothetical protein RM96_19670 [Cupriavidus sp. IDO]